MTKSQRNLTEARKAKIIEKVDRKGRKPERNGTGGKKTLQGLRSDRNLGPPSRVSTETRERKKKKLMEQWSGESRRH